LVKSAILIVYDDAYKSSLYEWSWVKRLFLLLSLIDIGARWRQW